MNWKSLLTAERFHSGRPLASFDGRNPYENDYSRIISSSFIRRLQDKTQVFPLEQSDFIRTRLTHSLEVSSIAGSIGKSVEKVLIESGKMSSDLKGLLPSLLFTSGLIHDLGNPPYGHFGEVAIQNFFGKYFKENSSTLSDLERADFIHFDGNVQTFRILRKLSFLGHEFSYNLTFPTLATIVKYPCDSLTGNKKSETKDINFKKFGYFSTEKGDYEKISTALGLNGCRHPATFLLEAADDIAYSAADIEDGMKLKSLNYEIVYDVFAKIAADGGEEDKMIFDTLKKYKNEADGMPAVGPGYLVSKFRIDTQVVMIQSVINQFIKVHDHILGGEYRGELLMDSPAKRIREGFKELSRAVFEDPNVMQAEIAGYEVISGLLDKFVTAAKSDEFHSQGKGLEGRYYRMISSSLRYIHEKYPSGKSREYGNLQLIVDFISGMTDSYALSYYKKLTGVSY
jgi:dGTPase